MAEIIAKKPALIFGKKRKQRIIIISLAVLLVGTAGVYAYEKMTAQQTASSFMQIVSVKRGDITESVSASGKVQAARQVTLNFPNDNETVSAIHVKIGDHV